MSISDLPISEATGSVPSRDRANWTELTYKALRSQTFAWSMAFCAAIVLCFWPLFVKTYYAFVSPESYYSHVVIIPFLSAYLIYDRWNSIKDTPVKPVTWVIVFLPMLLWANYIVARSPRDILLSICLIGSLCVGIVFVAGWRWLKVLAPPTFFLIFGLPIWQQVIDVYTQPLQRISSSLSFAVLQAVGMNPYKADETTIMTNHFQMFVGVPCSGLRTVLAVIGLSVYMVMIGGMRLWANLFLLAIAIPLAIAINGLRISMIGMVGETMGQEAGMKFHDTSGHIAIVVLVVSMWGISKGLGMK